MSTIVIETENLLLRELTDQDHARLHAIYLNPRVHRYLGGPPDPFDEHMAASLARWPSYYREHGFGLWAVERKDDGAFMGRIGLLAQEVDGVSEVEVGYALAEEFWGRGYAIEAARACRDWAFRNLPVDHVISLILPENRLSIRVAERNGMTPWKETEVKGHRIRVYRITRSEWLEMTSPRED